MPMPFKKIPLKLYYMYLWTEKWWGCSSSPSAGPAQMNMGLNPLCVDNKLPRTLLSQSAVNHVTMLFVCLQDISVDLSFNTFHMINDGVIRGSCPEYETRKDITSELRGTTRQCLVSLQEAMER